MNDRSQDGVLQRSATRRELIAGSAGLVAATALGSHSGRAQQRESEAAVVSSHHLATEAGVAVLEAGGTAADAAVAVASSLTIVEPWFSSALGGGTWALYFDAAAGSVTSLDGVGPVGSKASLEDYTDRARESGMHQAILPGAWDGWMLWLERFGRLDLATVLAPAIRLARDGFPASGDLVFWLERDAQFVLDNAFAAAIYAPDGAFPEPGDTLRQEALAATFESLANAYAGAGGDHGAGVQAARDFYYRGPIAGSLVAFSDANGGYLTLDDFAAFSAEIVDAISIEYLDGISVFQNPPNSQGITMLMALNILKGFDLSGLDPDHPDALHLQVEALKLAFSDRYFYVGDPARIDVPVAELLSEDHAAAQRARVDPGQAMRWPIRSILAASRGPNHTSTFHVVDREGNAAAVTTSLGGQFLVAGESGIHVNERMRFVSLERGNPNELTPGYKVRHTSCPYLALRGGRPYLIGGNTGVDTQPQGQLQQVVNIAQFGLTAQQAVDRPRFVSTAFPALTYPYTVGNRLQVEEGFPPETLRALSDRGHVLDVGAGIFGSANVIAVRDSGALEVGAESRAETAAGTVIARS